MPVPIFNYSPAQDKVFLFEAFKDSKEAIWNLFASIVFLRSSRYDDDRDRTKNFLVPNSAESEPCSNNRISSYIKLHKYLTAWLWCYFLCLSELSKWSTYAHISMAHIPVGSSVDVIWFSGRLKVDSIPPWHSGGNSLEAGSNHASFIGSQPTRSHPSQFLGFVLLVWHEPRAKSLGVELQ